MILYLHFIDNAPSDFNEFYYYLSISSSRFVENGLFVHIGILNFLLLIYRQIDGKLID